MVSLVSASHFPQLGHRKSSWTMPPERRNSFIDKWDMFMIRAILSIWSKFMPRADADLDMKRQISHFTFRFAVFVSDLGLMNSTEWSTEQPMRLMLTSAILQAPPDGKFWLLKPPWNPSIIQNLRSHPVWLFSHLLSKGIFTTIQCLAYYGRYFFRLSWHFLKLNSSLTLLGYLIPGLLANEFPWISEWRKSNINDEGRSKWILMCNKTNKIKKKLVIHQSSDLILSSLGAVNSRKFSSSSGLESLDEEVLFASAVSKKKKEKIRKADYYRNTKCIPTSFRQNVEKLQFDDLFSDRWRMSEV